jgi:large subunit ribosomal protein L25
MADQSNKISVEIRNEFGKGAARRLRAAHKIPAVLYGHGTEPQHLSLPGHETMLIIRKANQVLDLDIQGTSQLALVKDVQKDPVRQLIEHIDLVVVRRGEKVTVSVPVHVEGESAAGTISTLDATTLDLEVEATNIPENVVVNIEGAEDGTHVLAKDVQLPSGATLVSDPETLVVAVSTPTAADLGEEQAEEQDDNTGTSGEASEEAEAAGDAE